MEMKWLLLCFIIDSFWIAQISGNCPTTVTAPTNVEECTNFSDADWQNGDLCCYYESVVDATKKMCKTIPFSSRFDFWEYDIVGDTLYKVNCGLSKDNKKTEGVLTSCGDPFKTPTKVGNCKTYSSFVDSCCFYNANENDEFTPYPETKTGCYWLGAKFQGDVLWGSMKLKCSSNYMNSTSLALAIACWLSLFF